VGLERGPLSLVSTTEEPLGINNSGSRLEDLEFGSRDPSRWPRDTPLSTKIGTNFADKRGCRSVGIVRSQSQATEFSLVLGVVYLFMLHQFCNKHSCKCFIFVCNLNVLKCPHVFECKMQSLLQELGLRCYTKELPLVMSAPHNHLCSVWWWMTPQHFLLRVPLFSSTLLWAELCICYNAWRLWPWIE
jgi:hypothetical protein